MALSNWLLVSVDLFLQLKQNLVENSQLTISPHQSTVYRIFCHRRVIEAGYSEILIEAQLVSNGCLYSVLKGKAYSKALFCLKIVCEAMERLLYRSLLEEMSDVNISDPVLLLQFIQNITKETLGDTIEYESVNVVLQKYIAYENSVRSGYLEKTAAFWMAVIDILVSY